MRLKGGQNESVLCDSVQTWELQNVAITVAASSFGIPTVNLYKFQLTVSISQWMHLL
jgi:hypothetical protein